MEKPETLRFVLELTSDAFLGGAVPARVEVADGLRPASLRGVLHCAWRMVHGSLSPQALAREEARLFGTVCNQSGFDAGQGLVWRERGHAFERVAPGASYALGSGLDPSALAYLGYGLLHYSGRRDREALRAGGWAECTLAPPPGSARVRFTAADREGLLRALWLMGALLGCGSRTRRGFGSLQIAAWAGPKPPAPWPATCQSPAELRNAWRDFLADLDTHGLMAGELPQWTAISTDTRIFVWNQSFNTWQDALAALGARLRRFRQYYGAEQPGRGPVGQDHDLMAELANNRPVHRAPKRAAFGLPHNYYFSGLRRSVNVQPRNGDRRASPLFFHVTRLQTGRYVPVVAYVPATFLPNASRLSMRVSRGGRTVTVSPPDAAAIDHFLDGGPIEGYHDRDSHTMKEVHWPGLRADATEVGV